MHLEGTGGRHRARRAAGVLERGAGRHDGLEAVEEVAPGAHVARLFLDPDKPLEGGIGGQGRAQLAGREWIHLLEAQDRHVDRRQPALLPLLEQVVVDAPGTEEGPAHPAALSLHHPRIIDEPVEAAAGQLVDSRHRERVAEEALRAHHHEGLPEVAPDLLAEAVEELRRRRQVDDLHVVLGAELEEALEARARVLRALSLVAVRQEQDQAAHAAPLELGRGEQLIDDDLGAVDEVAELGLPDGQGPRVGARVAVLEGEDRLLGERAVDHLEAALVGRQVVERDPAGAVVVIAVDRVAVAERAALRVLAGQADGVPLEEQRADGERLGAAPVDRLILEHGGGARLHQALEPRVPAEAVRHRGDRARDRLEHFARHGGVGGPVGAGRLQPLPPAAEPLADLGRHGARGLSARHQGAAHLVDHVLELGLGEDAGADKLLPVDARHRRVPLDEPAHDRLGEAGVVELVVAVAAVADQVDDDVGVEGLPPGERQLGDQVDRLRVVGVDVEDRRVHRLGDVGGVAGRPRLRRRGGEADLVVDDDVDGAAGGVAGETAEQQRLGDHALAGEGGVAVHDDRHHPAALAVAQVILLGADDALDHRGHHLEVARVEREREVDAGSLTHQIVRVAHVVLDVAVALHLGGQGAALELGEDVLERLAEHVGQDVQPAAVRHAEDQLLDAALRRSVDQRVEQGDQGGAALEGEALGARIHPLELLLEGVGADQVAQEVELALVRQARAVPDRLHPLLQPVALALVGDVHVLDADRAGVGLLQDGEDLADGGAVGAVEAVAAHHLVEVRLAQAELRELEGRVAARALAERIDVGRHVAELPVGVDQIVDLDAGGELIARDALRQAAVLGEEGGSVCGAAALEGAETLRQIRRQGGRVLLVRLVGRVEERGGLEQDVDARHVVRAGSFYGQRRRPAIRPREIQRARNSPSMSANVAGWWRCIMWPAPASTARSTAAVKKAARRSHSAAPWRNEDCSPSTSSTGQVTRRQNSAA